MAANNASIWWVGSSISNLRGISVSPDGGRRGCPSPLPPKELTKLGRLLPASSYKIITGTCGSSLMFLNPCSCLNHLFPFLGCDGFGFKSSGSLFSFSLGWMWPLDHFVFLSIPKEQYSWWSYLNREEDMGTIWIDVYSYIYSFQNIFGNMFYLSLSDLVRAETFWKYKLYLVSVWQAMCLCLILGRAETMWKLTTTVSTTTGWRCLSWL